MIQKRWARVNEKEHLSFVEESVEVRPEINIPWKILIADDEDEIHAITRIVLENLTFEGRRLVFLSAYSGEETLALLRQHPDTAVVLLDVVMEEETTGLQVARAIRKDLRNTFVRIILRTGQPGQAPERQVTMDYDINDYKEKTELTVPKLFTTVMGALRAYRDLKTIEKSRRGLEQIVKASISLFEFQTIERFAASVLLQAGMLLQHDVGAQANPISGFITIRHNQALTILEGSGAFQNLFLQPVQAVAPSEILELLAQSRATQQSVFTQRHYVGYFKASNGDENLFYLHLPYPLSDIDRELLQIFSNNIAVGFDNIYLTQSLVSTQREVIFTLGQVIETRSKETNHHVKRVAAYSHLLALHAGLRPDDAELLRLASPLHDVGKIGIPDEILNKPGPLTDSEYQILKRHPEIGYQILKDSKQAILKAAATIALQHHEHWDGSGYPQGLKGEQIVMFARITRLADVFDVVMHHRIYEESWDEERVIAFFREQRGRQFDPRLIDLFLAHFPDFLALKETYPQGNEHFPASA